MSRVRITLDGRTYEVDLEAADGRLNATIEGRTFVVEGRTPAPGSRALDVTIGGAAPIRVQRLDLQRIRVDDSTSTFRLESVTRGTAGDTVGAEGARIHPPMPGKVVAVKVSPGQTVEPGQVLAVLEAMKMQNEVTSPAHGVVAKVTAKPGDTVDAQDVLLVLGPAPDNEAQGSTKELPA